MNQFTWMGLRPLLLISIIMEQKEQKERVRKKYSKADGRSQQPMSFRLDNQNAWWLSKVPNKGRLINVLLRDYYYKHRDEFEDVDD